MCSSLFVGGGCGCVFGLGIKVVLASRHTVGFTFNTVLASATCCGGCPHSLPGLCVVWVWVCVVGCL